MDSSLLLHAIGWLFISLPVIGVLLFAAQQIGWREVAPLFLAIAGILAAIVGGLFLLKL